MIVLSIIMFIIIIIIIIIISSSSSSCNCLYHYSHCGRRHHVAIYMHRVHLNWVQVTRALPLHDGPRSCFPDASLEKGRLSCLSTEKSLKRGLVGVSGGVCLSNTTCLTHDFRTNGEQCSR